MNDHAEIEELLGAYALDAVEPEEAEAIEEHLDTCPRCRAELAGHREVVSLLGDGGGAAPAGLWERLSVSLEEPPPPLRLVRVDGPTADPRAAGPHEPARQPRPRAAMEVRWGTAVAAAAAAAAVIGGLGIEVARLDHRTNHLLAQVQVQTAAESAASRTDARHTTLQSPDGKLALETVILPGGSGYVLSTNLPRLPADQIYQLWGLVGTNRRPLRVLGSQPQVAAFQVEGDMVGLAVTVERAPGVVTTDKTPVVVATLRS